MSNKIGFFEYGSVWREGDPPLTGGGPASVPKYDAQPEPLDVRRIICRLWTLTLVVIYAASIVTLWLDPLPADYPPTWQAIPIGSAVALLLWGITLTVCAPQTGI